MFYELAKAHINCAYIETSCPLRVKAITRVPNKLQFQGMIRFQIISNPMERRVWNCHLLDIFA